METVFLQSFIMAAAVGLASGSIGAFVVLRRMALVGDALSHVALPGIALAFAYGIDPLWGVIASLVGAACLIFWLEGKTRLPGDALVGILFTASLAVGILAIPDEEIIHSLFGEFPDLPPHVFALIVGTALGASAFVFFLTRRFAFRIMAPELAAASGVKRRHDFLFFLIFAVVVALGIKLAGTLLMGALTIIPAAIARNISWSIKMYIAYSALLGAGIAAFGVFLAHSFGLLPGPTIVLLGIGIFIVSLFRRT